MIVTICVAVLCFVAGILFVIALFIWDIAKNGWIG